MKTIGLFSGSFNPIHLGHTTLASSIIESTGLDEVLFVVSPHNPLKKQSELLDEQLRLKMVDLALQDYDNMHASDIEFRMPKPSYTVNTLRYLSAAHTDCKFRLIIGSDNLLIFNRWREYEYILEHYSVIVYPRKDDNIARLTELYPQVQIVTAPLLPISSTQIRQAIAHSDLSIRKWLNPQVFEFIIKNNLYRTKA